MTNSYHTVICSVTCGLVERPDRQCTPCVTLLTNPAPSYDSGMGYANGTLHFGDRDGFDSRKNGTTKKDGTTRKDGTERSTLPVGARDGLRTTLHFGITDGLIRKRKGTHLRTSSDQREEEERVDQTSDPPGPDNQPKRLCGTPWRTRPLTTVMSGTGRTTTETSAPPSG